MSFILLALFVFMLVLMLQKCEDSGSAAVRDGRTSKVVAYLESVIEMYRVQTGTYPSSLEDLTRKASAANAGKGSVGPWLKSIPKKRDGRKYQYDARTGKVIE